MFNKKLSITFEDFRSVINACAKILRDEVYKTLDAHPDVFTPRHRKMFEVAILPSALVFTEDELLYVHRKNKDGEKVKWDEVTYSKKEIAQIYNKGRVERMRTPAKANMSYKFEDGKLIITDLYISVNYDVLKTDLLLNLYRVNDFVECALKTWARHEAGHILDYILSYEGKPRSVLDKSLREEKKAQKEYNNWTKSVMPKGEILLPPELEKQRVDMYFNMPQEARADMLGGVDRRKANEFMFNQDGYRIVATIKSKPVKIKPVKEEPKKEETKAE